MPVAICFGHDYRQPSPGQCCLASWFTSRLQPALVLIQARVYASFLKMVNPLLSAFVRLRSISCSWQYSRREILRAKSPSLSSTVNVERRGNRASNTLTGADGLYNGRSVSRQNQPPITDSVEIWLVCASVVVGVPLNWAILRFLVKGIGRRGCAAFSNAGLFTIRNGARGAIGRACGELKTVRPGAGTRERFFKGEGEKRFGVAAGGSL